MSPLDERFVLADGRVPGESGGPIERPVPEDRPLPPTVDRPAPFPIKKRLIKIVAFAGPLGSTDGVTGEVTGLGLIVNVRAWLDVSDEKDILDWELSVESVTTQTVTTVDAQTGVETTVETVTTEGRFIILYTE